MWLWDLYEKGIGASKFSHCPGAGRGRVVKFAASPRSGRDLRRGNAFPCTHANLTCRGLNFLHFQIRSPIIAGIVRARLAR